MTEYLLDLEEGKNNFINHKSSITEQIDKFYLSKLRWFFKNLH